MKSVSPRYPKLFRLKDIKEYSKTLIDSPIKKNITPLLGKKYVRNDFTVPTSHDWADT